MTSSDLQLVKLSEIASFKYGKTIRKSEVHESEGYPVHSGYQVVGYLPNYMYQEPQLLIVCRGAGGTGDVKISPAKCSITNLAIVISCDLSKVDMGYLYWRLLLSDTYSLRTGSAQPQITINTLDSFEILIEPSILKQKEIAKHLFLLNEKIETNNQINQTLEQMAQAIFKSWFVDFEPVKAKIAALEAGGSEDDALLAAMQAISGKDSQQLTQLQTENPENYATLRATAELFPATMQESELGEIPEGWGCLALDEIARYQNGLALQKFRPENEDNFLPVVKIAQLRKGYADSDEKASPNIDPRCIIDNGDVVFSWSGSLIVDIWCGGKGALNQHLFKVTSEAYPKWLYLLFTKHHLEEFQRIAADKAVTMGHIKREHLKSAFCAVPQAQLISAAGKLLGSVIDKQIELRLEAVSLSELRDTLLPKLLSGELSVNQDVD